MVGGGCGDEGVPTAFNDDKLDSIASLLASKKNIIVLVGAGISVAAGIPDFRSPTTGLYNTINHVEYGLSSPEELFDIDVFTDNPTPFYKFAKSFGYYDAAADNNNINNTKHKFKSTISHYFLAELAKNKQLRRIYTQNIDGLELLAGVPPSEIVYAHGSLANGATCMKCSALYSAHDIAEDVRFGRVPLCTRSRSHTQHGKPRKYKKVKIEAATAETLTTPDYNSTTNYDETLSSTTPTITAAVTAVKKRTSTRLAAAIISSSKIAANKSDYNHDDDDNNVLHRRSLLLMTQHGLCGGIIKPNITFFGEKLNNQVGQWLQKDCNVADALLVMGTSLSVAPMSKVVHYLRSDIPRILINRTIVQIPKVSNNEDDGCLLFHTCLLGDCDVIVEALSHRMQSRHGIGNEGRGIATILGALNHDGQHRLNQRDDEARGHVQPKESILLFQGAEIVNKEVQPTTTLSKTIAHCDECQHEIQGQIYNCKTCFDYDLCSVCYSNPRVIHANGKHAFAIEG